MCENSRDVNYTPPYLIGFTNRSISGFGLPQNLLPGTSTPCTSLAIKRIEQLRTFLVWILLMQIWLPFSPAPHWNILLNPKDMTEPVQPLNINALDKVHVVEEFRQIFVRQNIENIQKADLTAYCVLRIQYFACHPYVYIYIYKVQFTKQFLADQSFTLSKI